MSELVTTRQRSRAEVLFCLDVLVRHLSDEDMIVGWLTNGVPDGTLGKWPTDEQVEPFLDYADDLGEFEDKVAAALRIIRWAATRDRVEYVKGAFA